MFLIRNLIKKFSKYKFLFSKKIRINSMLFIILIVSGCSESGDVDMGSGYKLEYDGKYAILILNAQNSVLVRQTVLRYGYDSTFIIASQRPFNIYPKRDEMNYSKYKEVFEKSNYLQFWIINKAEEPVFIDEKSRWSNVYGPFSKEHYLKKREEMQVPKELRF